MSGDIRARPQKTLFKRPLNGAIAFVDHEEKYTRHHEKAENRPNCILEDRFSNGESKFCFIKLAIFKLTYGLSLFWGRII